MGLGSSQVTESPPQSFRESPVISVTKTSLFPIFNIKDLCSKSEPTFLFIPSLLSVELMAPSPLKLTH